MLLTGDDRSEGEHHRMIRCWTMKVWKMRYFWKSSTHSQPPWLSMFTHLVFIVRYCLHWCLGVANCSRALLKYSDVWITSPQSILFRALMRLPLGSFVYLFDVPDLQKNMFGTPVSSFFDNRQEGGTWTVVTMIFSFILLLHTDCACFPKTGPRTYIFVGQFITLLASLWVVGLRLQMELNTTESFKTPLWDPIFHLKFTH